MALPTALGRAPRHPDGCERDRGGGTIVPSFGGKVANGRTLISQVDPESNQLGRPGKRNVRRGRGTT